MSTFQFDQCFNDQKIIRKCQEEGVAGALRFPARMCDLEDPQVLDRFMQLPNPLVTLDRRLPEDHAAFIPDNHPGIVVVSNAPGIPQTITTNQGGKILAQFKARLSSWFQISFQNSVIEITQESVEIWHVTGGKLVRDGYLTFQQTDWADQLTMLLQQNAQ